MSSKCLSKCRARSMSTYCVTRPQWVNKLFFIFTTLFSKSFHATVPSASMPFHSTTIFTLAYLLPLSLAHLPQQKTLLKLAILYNKSIADAHPSFLLKEAILLLGAFWTDWNVYILQPMVGASKHKVKLLKVNHIFHQRIYPQNSKIPEI